MIALLRVYFGDMPEAVYNTAVFFKNSYIDEWFEDPFVQRMVKGVDGATVLGNRLVQSKVMGLIPPTDLSGGVKTLILIYKMPERVFNASTCGDNCARWILQMAKKQDVAINLRHIMDFGNGKFDMEILNTGQKVHSMAELAMVAGDFLRADS